MAMTILFVGDNNVEANRYQNRIDQMDGGAFQNLCDAYLSYKGYKNVYSLGMHTGTDKTAKETQILIF